jgi:Fe-S-cluster containining protein
MLPKRESNAHCNTCKASCCRLQVLLFDDPGVPPSMIASSDWGGQVMRREEDGWCTALDRNTLRCTIYEQRPQLCRDYAMGSYECVQERRCDGDEGLIVCTGEQPTRESPQPGVRPLPLAAFTRRF